MTNPHHALRHYKTAIRALSDGQYGDLTARERRTLIRVLREQRHQLLRRVLADGPDADASVSSGGRRPLVSSPPLLE
ncbi:MAG: hypothetical protein ABEL97_09500 [Salinibacter sp.]